MVQPRKAPKQARAKQKVAKILHTAELLLSNEGYDNFSTNRVAKEADINIASLYQYFPNKEALIYAINRKMLDEVLESCARYEAQMDELSWESIFDLMDEELQTDKHHVQLVRALDIAIVTTPELMAMELEHAERIAQFYVRIFKHYGSSWPDSTLLNTGRLIYKISNISYYDLDYLNPEDEKESTHLYKQHIRSLVERVINGEPFTSAK